MRCAAMRRERSDSPYTRSSSQGLALGSTSFSRTIHPCMIKLVDAKAKPWHDGQCFVVRDGNLRAALQRRPDADRINQPGPDTDGINQPGPDTDGINQPGPDADGINQPGPDADEINQPGPDADEINQPGPDPDRILHTSGRPSLPECMALLPPKHPQPLPSLYRIKNRLRLSN